MAFLSGLFSKKEEDFDTVLSNLKVDIEKRQQKLSEIRLRERRSTLTVTLYTLAAWVAYVSLWYMGLLTNRRGIHGLEKALMSAPVVIGPIVILFIRRIVQIWYKRKGDAEEKTLQALSKQRRTKLDEFKKKTNFYMMRDIIQRHDEPASSPGPGLRQQAPLGGTQPSTPQRPPQAPNGHTQLRTPNPFSPQPPTPLPTIPPRKQWYDKLADALLGDDDHTPNAPASRYALICEKCFAHNGLVKESMWADAQYVCPKCNYFNASVNAKKHARTLTPSPRSASPKAVLSPPPPHDIVTPNKRTSPSLNSSPPSDEAAAAETSMMEIDDDA